MYLEVIAIDPEGTAPGRARWFGLVATTPIDDLVAGHPAFGEIVPLPPSAPEFAFSIASDGALPMDGALPFLIDHREHPTDMADIPDLGARLLSLSLSHPEPARIEALYHDFAIDRSPSVEHGEEIRLHALIKTSDGARTLF